MARDPKHDVLFDADPDRAEDAQEPLLPDAALQRLRVGEADEPGLLPRHEGGRRLRQPAAPSIARSRPSPTTPTASRRASGTTTTSRTSRSCATCSTSTARWPPASSGTAGRTPPAWRRAASRGAVADPERLRVPDVLHRGRQGRHPLPAAALRRRRQAGAHGRLRHRLRLRLPLLPAAAVPDPVLQQAHGRVRRLVREPRPLLARDDRAGEGGGRRRHRHRVRLSCDMFLGEPGTQLERDAVPFVQLVDHLVDVWDINLSGISEWGEDATPSRFYPHGPRDPVAEAHQGGHEEARARRRPLDEPRRDGRGDRERLARHHRDLPPLDLRPVPAPEDRRGPPRRHPRVHRLQRLHLPLGDRRAAPHLHPERDRGRGVPARLASGEVREGRERRQRRARRRRRPGRHGSGHGARQARHAARPPRRGAGRHGRDHALDPAASRPRRVGPRRQLPAHPDRQAEERRVHPEHDARRQGRRRVRRRDRDRRDRLLLGDGRAPGLHARHDPRRGRLEAVHPDARPAHGRGQGGAGREGRRRRQRRLLHGRLDRREARRRRASRSR